MKNIIIVFFILSVWGISTVFAGSYHCSTTTTKQQCQDAINIDGLQAQFVSANISVQALITKIQQANASLQAQIVQAQTLLQNLQSQIQSNKADYDAIQLNIDTNNDNSALSAQP